MSKKKNKKRHSQSTTAAKRRAIQEEIADQKSKARNRLKPAARNLLLTDLVILAATEFLLLNEIISENLASFVTLMGVGLILLALYIQFSKKFETR